jgi:hypothetical protein
VTVCAGRCGVGPTEQAQRCRRHGGFPTVSTRISVKGHDAPKFALKVLMSFDESSTVGRAGVVPSTLYRYNPNLDSTILGRFPSATERLGHLT